MSKQNHTPYLHQLEEHEIATKDTTNPEMMKKPEGNRRACVSSEQTGVIKGISIILGITQGLYSRKKHNQRDRNNIGKKRE